MNNGFSSVLSELRKEKGVNQRKAAAALNVSQALLSHYENAQREPGIDFIINASSFYGVSTDYLLGISPLRSELQIDENDSTSDCADLMNLSANAFKELFYAIAVSENSALRRESAKLLALSLYYAAQLLSFEKDDFADSFADRSMLLDLCRAKQYMTEASVKTIVKEAGSALENCCPDFRSFIETELINFKMKIEE